jgi:hypothetical protein
MSHFVKVPFSNQWINRDLITKVDSTTDSTRALIEPTLTIFFSPNHSIEIRGKDSVTRMRALLGLPEPTPAPPDAA